MIPRRRKLVATPTYNLVLKRIVEIADIASTIPVKQHSSGSPIQ
jgi:hypothetical protein